MNPTVGSLCTGIGGIDLGLQRAGFQIAWQCEIDPFCRRILQRHWPDVTRYDDLKELHPDELAPVDLVAAGFPCQPVSLADRGRAQDDERWLWPDIARILRVLRPRLVLLENVSGLLARGFGQVLGELAALGYDAQWARISAADVGAPHRRQRIWVVADTDRDTGWDQPGLRGGQDRTRAPIAPVERSRPSVADATGGRGQWRAAGPGDPASWRPSDLSARPSRRDAQPVLGRVLDGLPARLDRPRWPAGPGQPQHDWEPPRTVGRGIPNRAKRVGALGNAVVPQIVELIGAAILQDDQP